MDDRKRGTILGQCLNLAEDEMLKKHGELDLKELPKRAEEIFHALNEYNYWNIKPREEDKSKNKTPRKCFKICPRCGEEVLETWPNHQYQNDGTPCGYIFHQ